MPKIHSALTFSQICEIRRSMGFLALLHKASPLSVSTLLLRDLPEVKLHAPSSGSDDYRSFALDLMAQICFSSFSLSSCCLDVKLDGPDLVSPANLMATVLPPELENFLPPLGRFSEVSKASTFASSASSIPWISPTF
jgi:hypothetical protein